MLGWTPTVIMRTPMVQIVMALEARVDWTIKTNPFGSAKSDGDWRPMSSASKVRAK